MSEETNLVVQDEDKKIARELIALTNCSKDTIKRSMDENYLQMLVDNNPNLGKEHFVEFITKCQLTGADPRLNQIYLIVYEAYNSQTGKKEPKGTTVFSYQYFIKLAQETGQLEEFDVDLTEDTYIDFNSGRKRPSLTAVAWVKRKGQGKLKYKARLWEFAKTNKDGSLYGNWKNSPYLMLEKCAIANVMRWAFPETLGNLYVADEMEKVTSPEKIEISEKKPVENKKPELIELKKSPKEMKDEILDFLENVSIDWKAKIGKTKEEMIEKVITSGDDIEKIKSMHEFITRLS